MNTMASQITNLLRRLFRRRSKKTSKLRVTGLCAGNSPVTGQSHAQRASNAEIFPIDDVIMKQLQLYVDVDWFRKSFYQSRLVCHFNYNNKTKLGFWLFVH